MLRLQSVSSEKKKILSFLYMYRAYPSLFFSLADLARLIPVMSDLNPS